MWAISGGTDYENDVTNVIYSNNGFATAVNTIPTYTVANAILRRRRSGGAVKFVAGAAFPAGGKYSHDLRVFTCVLGLLEQWDETECSLAYNCTQMFS